MKLAFVSSPKLVSSLASTTTTLLYLAFFIDNATPILWFTHRRLPNRRSCSVFNTKEDNDHQSEGISPYFAQTGSVWNPCFLCLRTLRMEQSSKFSSTVHICCSV